MSKETEWRVTKTSHSVHVEHPTMGGFAVVSKPAGDYAASILNNLESQVSVLREALRGIVPAFYQALISNEYAGDMPDEWAAYHKAQAALQTVSGEGSNG